jgi:tetratricopeptide (TPR) repeat protein
MAAGDGSEHDIGPTASSGDAVAVWDPGRQEYDGVVADEARIEALRKRLQKDPGSIAFAQLAEEYRRAGRFRDAIDVCRAGLARHPGYLSARVTFGRALLEVGDVESAERELNDVLRVAPDNLSAIRGIAEVHRKKGEVPEALEQFRSAFEMASPDPAIEAVVRDFRREAMAAVLPGQRVGPAPAPAGGPGAAAGQPVRAEDDRVARRTLAYLERWLQAILTDRRTRLYTAQA